MNEIFTGTATRRALSTLTLVVFMIMMVSYAALNFEKMDFLNPVPATISVSGQGEMLAVPDIGQFSFSVMAEAQTATEAQEMSGTKINSIINYLKEQGIEDKDIKTQNYSLNPKYRYEERICLANSYCPPGDRIQDGYEVSQYVSVKIRETDTAGAIIAGVGELGATNISGLNFTIDDTEAIKEQAREKAIENAKEKAEKLADQLGVKLVRIAGFYESGGNYYEPYAFEAKGMGTMDMAEEGGFGGATMPVGEDSVTVTVNITYEVK